MSGAYEKHHKGLEFGLALCLNGVELTGPVHFCGWPGPPDESEGSDMRV